MAAYFHFVDENEFVLLLILSVVAGRWAYRFALRLYCAGDLLTRSRQRWTYGVAAVGCLAVLWTCLATVAARDVRHDLGLQALFVAGGLAAIAVTTVVTGVLGLDALADGLERDNASARIAICGLWIATTVCSIGANIGEGSFVGTTFIPLALSVAALGAIVAIVSAATGGLLPITVERDSAAGIRFAGLMIAASIPLAHSSSGDWLSLRATSHDFVAELPALIGIVGLAVGIEKIAGRTQRRDDRLRRGLAPALLFVLLAIAATVVRAP